MNDNLIALAINRISFLTGREKIMLYESAASSRWLATLSFNQLQLLVGRAIRSSHWSPAELLSRAEGDCSYLQRQNIAVVLYNHLPPQLREIYDPPFLLYLRGTIPNLNRPWVALVGTRKPSNSGRRAAANLGGDLSRRGIPVISGLAYGVDAVAHRATVVAGGVAVAVLGCGIDRIYPGVNRTLARNILESNGAIMSEYAPGIAPLRFHFPARNRIISGLARAVVVIEAPQRSGALITADYALQQGRDLFIHRDGLGGENGAGGRKLSEEGAPIIDSFDDIARDWGWSTERASRASIATSTASTVSLTLATTLEEELGL